VRRAIMQLLRDEKGEGRAKLIITIIVVAFIGFCLYQFVSARIKVYAFKDSIVQEVKNIAPQPRVTGDYLKDRVFELSEEKLGFRLKEEEVQTNLDSQKIEVKVDYIMPVKFPFYTWEWKQVIDHEFRRF
jgi:hypothetical protein